jgi:hypothetical protein
MSDEHTPEANHLDDEVLSAVLDGEASAEESAHADSCAACSTRLAALRDASLLVRTPVPPADPARREVTIARALDAATAEIVPLRRRRTPPAWLAAAAAIVVAIGALSLLQAAGDDDDSRGATTAAGDTRDADDSLTTLAQSELFAAAGPIDGGDLGEIDDDALRATIDGAVSAARTTADDTGGGGSGGSDAASGQSTADASPAAGATSAATAAVPCETKVHDDNPQLGSLAYHAAGTRDGEAVVVLAFDVGDRRWIYVVATDECAVRNQQTYRI